MSLAHDGTCFCQLFKTGVAVEKGTKAVISGNFSVYGERKFNNLQTTFCLETPRKEFFNSHVGVEKLCHCIYLWRTGVGVARVLFSF